MRPVRGYMSSTAEFPRKIICVVGARPNFMKVAPIIRAFAPYKDQLQPYLVHTGQHYDKAMKDAFFDQLGIPEPDIDLGVGSGTHAEQTANVMLRFEPVVDEQDPLAVLVVGDVNSTIACALVAVKKHIPVIHVESGLRSGDRAMPEEINRVLTDQISDFLFTTERSAADNLNAEGISGDKVIFTGNVMIDTLLSNLAKATPVATTLSQANMEAVDEYALVTMHRPSNVDDKKTLTRLLSTLNTISKKIPIIIPLHPRTRGRIEEFGLSDLMAEGNYRVLEPQGYLEMIGLMHNAKLVLTDSGGIQEETTALGVPCITLRESTERPITVDEGTNTIVGSDPEAILASFEDVMSTGGKGGRVPEFWDGKAAERIVSHLSKWAAEQV